MAIVAIAYAGLQKIYPDSEAEFNEARRMIYNPPPEGSNYCALTPHPAFSDRADYFDSPGLFVFNGGSIAETLYSNWAGYKDFKEKLAHNIVKRDLDDIMSEPGDDSIKDTNKGSFFELLHMTEADFRPLFGPNTTEKLFADFSSHVNEAESLGGSFYQTYRKLYSCFELAQKTGAVLITTR